MRPFKSAFAVIALVFVGCTSQTGDVTVRNETTEVIPAISIEVSGSTFSVSALAPGAQETFQYPIRHEDGYTLEVRYASDRVERAEVGYVTAGLPAHSRIDITPTGIVHTHLTDASDV